MNPPKLISSPSTARAPHETPKALAPYKSYTHIDIHMGKGNNANTPQGLPSYWPVAMNGTYGLWKPFFIIIP